MLGSKLGTKSSTTDLHKKRVKIRVSLKIKTWNALWDQWHTHLLRNLEQNLEPQVCNDLESQCIQTKSTNVRVRLAEEFGCTHSMGWSATTCAIVLPMSCTPVTSAKDQQESTHMKKNTKRPSKSLAKGGTAYERI